jgi:RNA polymerase sigma-70 factor, ECF subfamily
MNSNAPDNTSQQERDGEFLALLAKCEPQLAACIHAMVPVWQDAEDILQKTRATLWLEFGNFRPGSDFAAWARTIGRYEVRSHVKKNRSRPRLFSEELEESLLEQFSRTPEEENRRWTSFLECSQKLGREARQILQRVYVDRHNVKQVAAQLGRTPGGTYMALSRIRRRLMECIEGRLQEEE